MYFSSRDVLNTVVKLRAPRKAGISLSFDRHSVSEEACGCVELVIIIKRNNMKTK
jgi:hypothetical protein